MDFKTDKQTKNLTLLNIHVGDSVIIRDRYSEAIANVERTTKNYIIVNNTKYRKTDGYATGTYDKWGYKSIHKATPDEIERIKNKQLHNKLVRIVSNIPFQSLTNEQLKSIIEIVKQQKNEEVH